MPPKGGFFMLLFEWPKRGLVPLWCHYFKPKPQFSAQRWAA